MKFIYRFHVNVGVIRTTSTLPKHGDIILNSMSKQEKNGTPLVWVELTFKRYEDTMILHFHFYFLFRTNCKRTTVWERLLSLLWYFFETTWSQLCSKFFRNTYEEFCLQNLKGTFTVEDFIDIDKHRN